MANTWVTTNTRKIGTIGRTLSRTPRKLSNVSQATHSTIAIKRHSCHGVGKKLKIASAPLAMEMAIVST